MYAKPIKAEVEETETGQYELTITFDTSEGKEILTPEQIIKALTDEYE